MLNVRKATNNWVAKYRRDNKFGGRPSYGWASCNVQLIRVGAAQLSIPVS